MLTKIVKEPTSRDKILSGEEVTQEQLDGLSDNYFVKTYIMDGGTVRRMNSSNPLPHNDWKTRDTRSIYFTKAKIEELFADNAGSDGIRIYLGLHDKNIYPGVRDAKYENKVMVVLVATKTEVDMKDFNDKVMIAGIRGGGYDNGKLCPPDQTCPA
jgi:hypothetical protein